jgi:hypothetical protein
MTFGGGATISTAVLALAIIVRFPSECLETICHASAPTKAKSAIEAAT